VPEGELRFTCHPAKMDGTVPEWASGVTLTRNYVPDGKVLTVHERITRVEDQGRAFSLTYVVPEKGYGVEIETDGLHVERRADGRRIVAHPAAPLFSLNITYRL